MKPADALSKDARALLRAARGGDDIPAEERQRVLQAFRQRVAVDEAIDEAGDAAAANAPRLHAARAFRSGQRRALPRPVRRVAWALAAVISTGSLAALAREGAFEGWGAAIERMLGTLAGESSTHGKAPAEPAARGVSQVDATQTSGIEPAVAGALGRSADEPAPAARELSSDAEPATQPPASEGLPAAEAATDPDARASAARSNTGPNASRERHLPSAVRDGAADPEQVRAARPPASATSRLEPIELRREPARAVSAESTAPRAKTPAPDASFPGARAPQPARASEELDLIVTARNALAARRHADARAAAERHARQFPSGVFGEERDAILALCACRETGARERARSFVERRPDSLFAERIREDCKLSSNLVPRDPPAGTH
jgi:hypothetical protein